MRYIIIFILLLILFSTISAHAEVGTASWYDYKSCIKEGTSGITASGEVMKDGFTCASWQYPFGTRLKVSRLDKKGKVISSIIVRVTDRGPSKRLVKKGRIIDLNKQAFSGIARVSEGVVAVLVEVVN